MARSAMAAGYEVTVTRAGIPARPRPKNVTAIGSSGCRTIGGLPSRASVGQLGAGWPGRWPRAEGHGQPAADRGPRATAPDGAEGASRGRSGAGGGDRFFRSGPLVRPRLSTPRRAGRHLARHWAARCRHWRGCGDAMAGGDLRQSRHLHAVSGQARAKGPATAILNGSNGDGHRRQIRSSRSTSRMPGPPASCTSRGHRWS